MVDPQTYFTSLQPERRDRILSYFSGGMTSSAGNLTTDFVVNVRNTSTKWWNDVKTWFDKAASGGTTFETALSNTSQEWAGNLQRWWKDQLSFKHVDDFKTNLKNDSGAWYSNLTRWWKEKVMQPIEGFRVTVKNDSSTWWHDTEKWWNGAKGVLEVVIQAKNTAKSMWDNLKKWWEDTAGTLTTKLEIKTPTKWNVEWTTNHTPGGTVKLPKLIPMWQAKGAIFEGATLFGMLGDKLLGAGEAGKEALLPLEQNTGWMDTIAEKVRDTMLNASAFEYAGVGRILDRLDAIEARLMSVDDNTRVQAEKPENTYVTIGGKAVRDAVIRQGKADGFSFA